MGKVRVVFALLLLIVGLLSYSNPNYVDDALERNHIHNSNHDLLNLQDNEEWLILKISFPNKPFDSNELNKLFEGPYSAEKYIKSLNKNSSLNVTIIEESWDSPKSDSFWGQDSQDGRDVGVENGIQDLIHSSVPYLLNDIDLSKWDLNNDGTLDRLLILHSGSAQESNGQSSSIWSHFSGLDEPIEISKWSVEHYTLVSLSSGLGTLMHEMLHQMGAVDLYDVHSDTPTSNWNGLGDWDIMASGNWNGDGMVPALPSASTLELIGSQRSFNVIPNDNSVSIYPLSSGGNSITIDIAPNEKIHISLRSGGFDSELPGSGILVEYQDKNNGNLDNNLVNIDPEVAWVKIIEADGNDALIRGRNSGEVGDLFSLGDSFGNEGVQIRDNRGRLVTWAASIINANISENGSWNEATISFVNQPIENLEILTPRTPILLLPNDKSYAIVEAEEECELYINLNSQGNYITKYIDIIPGKNIIEIINSSIFSQSKGHLRGQMGCKNSNLLDIDLDWIKVGHKISNDTIETIIPWDEDSEVILHPEFIGNGSRIYTISLSGAISRICTPITQGNISPGDPIVIAVSPNGLLKQGMIAKGDLILTDSNSMEERIPIILQSESPFIGKGILPWISQPSNGIFIICILAALSLIGNKSIKNKSSSDGVIPP
ncbi:MAG: immune inhibitor A domain-containing protein [Candidatus Thalassarchaeaceae archaeon]